MDPAANNNHHEPEEEGCELCGFMRPDFRDEEDLDTKSRELQATAEGGGSSKIIGPSANSDSSRKQEIQVSSLVGYLELLGIHVGQKAGRVKR
jgi:hypothetical protein